MDRLPEIEPNRAQWRRWLAAHHDSSRGIWMVRHKKRAGPMPITLEDAIQEAPCFGWVISRVRPIDDQRSALLCTPRRPGSIWSKANKQRVADLTERGLMTHAGQRVIEAAKRDGSWRSLDAVEEQRVPADLAQALAADPAAEANFSALSVSARKSLLWRIESARRPETRKRRIDETVRWAASTRRPPSSADPAA